MNSTKLIELGNAAYKEVSHKTDKRSFLDGFYKGILHKDVSLAEKTCYTCKHGEKSVLDYPCEVCCRANKFDDMFELKE